MHQRRRSPPPLARTLRQRFLDIPDHAVTAEVRGFRVTCPEARDRLDAIGRSFLSGYRAGLSENPMPRLEAEAATMEPDQVAFAVEGAAMSLRLLDLLSLGRGRRVRDLLEGLGADFPYVVHVGVGWAQAQLRLPPGMLPRGLDPLLTWLSVDGQGFSHGYLRHAGQPNAARAGRFAPPQVRAVFDQGLGRSLWFSGGMSSARVIDMVAGFEPGRHADLWSGVGLACTHAGGADVDGLATLRLAAGAQWTHLAQGACFAAEARDRSGLLTQDAETACRVLVGLGASQAARLARDCRPVPATKEPATADLYEEWRRALRSAVKAAEVAP